MNNSHKNYGKIHRLGKEEVEGILTGKCMIQEKIDGANTSIWLGEDGQLKLGSRTRVLRDEEEFNGFVKYAKEHPGISSFLIENPTLRLFGEWLVRHTIPYRETAYRKFYLFDIWDESLQRFLPPLQVKKIGELYHIEIVPMHGEFINPTIEQLQEYIGKTDFGDRGEGIVIKNYDFINSFGELAFAKVVTPSFMEDNAVAFGGNNKYSETYHETYLVNKYMTLPRVKKIIDKIQPEINEKLDLKHIPRICNSAYHDMLVEEIWEIQKNTSIVNFKILKRIGFKKAKQLFVDIINNDINIHDTTI